VVSTMEARELGIKQRGSAKSMDDYLTRFFENEQLVYHAGLP